MDSRKDIDLQFVQVFSYYKGDSNTFACSLYVLKVKTSSQLNFLNGKIILYP